MQAPAILEKGSTNDPVSHLPERAEIAEIFQQSGAFDGFSLEWVFDRVEQSAGVPS